MPFSAARRVFVAITALFLAFCTATAQNLDCVVIDAGHGGHDSGAISADGRLKEKNVVLDIALRLGRKIEEEFDDVKVIYTRDKDVFVPLEQRSDIANKKHADLFISIHCNSVPKGKAAPSGCETFVMGMHKNEANMEVCKTENSVILLEEDYSTKYQGYDPNDTESFIFFNLMQNAYFEQSLIMADLCQQELHKGPIAGNRGIKQGGLLVLWRTTMPSVLVELGFITNSGDRSVLASEAKRDALATDLFNAFARFKEQYDIEPGEDKQEDSVGVTADKPEEAEPAAVEKADAPEGYFTIQVFAGSKKLAPGSSEFKGEKDTGCHLVGNTYKYTVGRFGSRAEADSYRAGISAKFPGCFVIHSSAYKD